MQSAFGIVHKAERTYVRDAKGRFAPKNKKAEKPARLTDEEYDSESESLAIDIKQLYRAEGDEERWQHWRKQLLAAKEYYESIDEPDLIEEVEMSLYDSEKQHKIATAMQKKKK